MTQAIDQSWVGATGHHYCSPSSLSLRAACPGSARLERDTERSSIKLPHRSPAADRGTSLHSHTEHLCDGSETEEALESLSEEDQQQVIWTKDRTMEIVNRFIGSGAIVMYEVQIDLSPLGIVNGKYGSRVDCLIIIPGSGAVVIDWKYGVMWVSEPEWNLQLKAYSWGIHNTYGGNIEAIILQPSSPEGKEYMSHVFSEEDFDVIGKQIKEIVSRAMSPDAPLIRGPHCEGMFCSCRSFCPLWKKSILEIPDGKNFAAHFEMLSPEDRAKFLDHIKTIMSVAGHCYSIADQMIVQHNLEIGGKWYVGEGRPSYVCGDKAKYLDSFLPFAEAKGIATNKLFTEPKEPEPKSKSDVVKLLGNTKAVQNAIKELYVKIPGEKTLKRRRG